MCQINMISSIKIYRCFTFYIHFTGYVSRLLRLSPFLRKFTARTPSTNSILIRQDFFFAPLHSVSGKKRNNNHQPYHNRFNKRECLRSTWKELIFSRLMFVQHCVCDAENNKCVMRVISSIHIQFTRMR